MGLQTSIRTIWLIFALVFGLLAYHHWQLSKKISPQFRPPEIPYWEPTEGIPINTGIADADIKKAFDDFSDGLNSYIKDYNESYSTQHRLQAFGYLAALGTALFSLGITI